MSSFRLTKDSDVSGTISRMLHFTEMSMCMFMFPEASNTKELIDTHIHAHTANIKQAFHAVLAVVLHVVTAY